MFFDVEELLSGFRVSKELGFLCKCYDTVLPDKYKPWIEISDSVKDYLDNDTIRDVVLTMPVIPCDELETYEELRQAHIYLTTLVTAYLWCKGRPGAPSVLPRCLAQPYLTISERVGLPPVVCHPTVCCANWRPIDHDVPFAAENLELISFNPLRTPGNAWFFTLTAQIEKDFGEAIYHIVNVTGRAVKGIPIDDQIEPCFAAITASLVKGLANLKRLPERLPAAEFYHKLRPFLWGYNVGAVEKTGVIPEGCENQGPLRHNGASAAQSSIIPLVDAFLRVQHSGNHGTFLEEQIKYMAKEHGELILWVKKNTPIDENTPGRKEAVEFLRNFRSEHLKTVSLYILSQTSIPGTGTGGTPFMNFLKTLRDESQ